MPIPTSLIVVLLVVAWLAVLVPMVARRREHVPEAEEDGVRFRVLRRASASIKRRRTGRPTEEIDDAETDLDEDDEDKGELDEELLDDDLDAEGDDDQEFAEEPEPATVGVSRHPVPQRAESRTPVAAELSAPQRQPESIPDPSHERTARTAVRESRYETPIPASDLRTPEPAYQPTGSSTRYVRPEQPITYVRPEQSTTEDDERYRPVPQRRGRGGYDPEAAELTRTYRYKRRRRVTLFLLLVTVAFGLAAYFVLPVLWAGAGVFGLLLVSYLAYLRRQVRIEENIRQRRLAKLRRARQTRPEFHVSSRPAAPAAAGPLAQTDYTRGRTVVDLDDDDPSFDDLEYYQPVAYQRASGQ